MIPPSETPPRAAVLRGLARLHFLEQSAGRAVIVWLPVSIGLLALGFAAACVAIALAGLGFTLILRGVVRASRCPACGVRFGRNASLFRGIWDQACCVACGVSLFELRRFLQREADRGTQER